MRVALLALLLCACDTRRSVEPAVRFAVEQLDEHREQADKALARKADPTVPCAAVTQALEELRSAPDWAQDSARRAQVSCKTALFAFANERAATIGRLRRNPTAECVDLDRAVHLLQGLVPADPEAVGLERRRKALCP